MTENSEFESEVFTLTDEDGNENQFELLGRIELDGSTYLAFVPSEGDDDEYVILKLTIDEDGSELLVTIDDDDEFDRVADEFEDQFMGEFDLDDEEDEEEDSDEE